MRDGTAGADRRVCEVGPREGGAHDNRRVVVPSAVIADETGLGLGRPQPALQVTRVGQLDTCRPGRGGRQHLGRLGGLSLATSDDGQEVAVAHDSLDTGHGRNVRDGDVFEVSARAGRPHDPRVQHAVELQVVDEAWAAKHLVGQVDPSQVLRRGRCELDLKGGVADPDVEVDDAGEVCIRADAGAVGGHEHAGYQSDLRGTEPRFVRGRAAEQLARLRAYPPDRRTGDRDRQAACSHPLIRRPRRVGRGGPDRLGRNIELMGRDLSQGREDPLPELDLADAQPDHAVVGDGQPRRDPWIGDKRDGQFGCHFSRPGVEPAAASTASTKRKCVPQRHRLRSNAADTSSRVGRGLSRSSAAALTIIPAMQ